MGRPAPGKTSIALFLTWDVSLALWREKGLLQREVRFYEALAARGIRVVFLSWGGAEDMEIAKTLKGIEVVPLYTRVPRPARKMMRALVSFYAPWAARDVLRGADILKTNQMWGAWCGVMGKWIARRPLIVRTGFELYDFTIRQGHGAARRGLIRLLSRMAYGAADRIYLATAADRAFVTAHFHADPGKIEIRPNWIDTDLFRPLAVPEEGGRILYVGRLTAQKNLAVLIEALAGTPWALDIYGDGDLREELERLALRTGAAVSFMGAVPNDALPAVYNRYPVFVLPSLYEGNPKTLLEAMACGRAVLGADADGINSVIRSGENGLLCAATVAGIRAGLDALMADGADRKRYGDAARLYVRETCGFEKLVDAEIADYARLKGTE